MGLRLFVFGWNCWFCTIVSHHDLPIRLRQFLGRRERSWQIYTAGCPACDPGKRSTGLQHSVLRKIASADGGASAEAPWTSKCTAKPGLSLPTSGRVSLVAAGCYTLWLGTTMQGLQEARVTGYDDFFLCCGKQFQSINIGMKQDYGTLSVLSCLFLCLLGFLSPLVFLRRSVRVGFGRGLAGCFLSKKVISLPLHLYHHFLVAVFPRFSNVQQLVCCFVMTRYESKPTVIIDHWPALAFIMPPCTSIAKAIIDPSLTIIKWTIITHH